MASDDEEIERLGAELRKHIRGIVKALPEPDKLRPEAEGFVAGAHFVISVLKEFNIDITLPMSVDIIADAARATYPDYEPETDHVERAQGGSHRPLRIPKRG